MVQSRWTQRGKQTRICDFIRSRIDSLFFQSAKTKISGIEKPRGSLWRDITPFPFLLTKKVGAAERCTATSDMFTWHINQTSPPKKNAIWNTGRGTRRPQLHEIFCLIISTARPVFIIIIIFFSFCPVVWPKCLCSSRFRGVGGGRAGRKKRWGVLAIHVWSKSRYIECVTLASLYLMEAPIHPPSFFLGEKSLNSRCLPLKIKLLFFPFMIDIWVYYTAVCSSHVPHPVPTSLIHIELYICLHTKNLKSNTRLSPRRLLSFQSVHSRTVCQACRQKSVVTFSFFIFSLIYCHIHISCILLHCYCTGPGYSGGVKRRDLGWDFLGGQERRRKGKESNKYLK